MLVCISKRIGKHQRARSILAVAAWSVLGAGAMWARADTTATWMSETSADWTDTSMWSNSPSYPNNGSPANVNYQAIINAVGGNPYTVTLDSDVNLNDLTIDSADATLDQTSGTLQAGTVNINNGTYQMDGGTIANSTINLAGGSISLNSGTLNGVSVTGGNLYGGNLLIQNGLTLGGNTLTLASATTLIFDGPSQTIDQGRIYDNSGNYMYPDDGGTLVLGGPNSSGSVTLTLGSGAILEGTLTIADAPNSSNAMINQGIINADVGPDWYTRPLSINTATFVNDGLAESSNGQSLNIQANKSINFGTVEASNSGAITFTGDTLINEGTIIASSYSGVLVDTANFINEGLVESNNGYALNINARYWVNAGTIEAINGGTMYLTVNFPTSQMGTITADATSSINISGTLMNSGRNLALGGTGLYILNGAEIDGGTMDLSSGSNLSVVLATMDDVCVTGGNVTVGGGWYGLGTLYLRNGLTLDSGRQVILTNSGTLVFDGPSQTVDNLTVQGTSSYATVELSGPTSAGSVTLTLGANSVFHGALNVNDGTFSGSTLINNGTINADNPSAALSINVTNLVNNNILEATGGGTLNIVASNWTNSGTISARSGGTVAINGNLTVADIQNIEVDPTATLDIAGTLANTSSVFSVPATGTFNLTGGSVVGGVIDESSGNLFNMAGGTLDGVSITGGDLNLVQPPGQWLGSSTLVIKGALSMDPGRQIHLNGNALTLDGPSQTIEGLTISDFPGYNENEGIINVSGTDSPGPVTLTLNANTTLEGGMRICTGSQPGSTLVNNGTINADYSSNQFTNALGVNVDNFTNDNIAEATDGGILYIVGVNFTNTGYVLANSASQAYISEQNITNEGLIKVTGSATLGIQGNWNNGDAGLIYATDSSTLALGGSLTTAGLGRVTVDSTSSICLTGTLINTGATFITGNFAGSCCLESGTITGGTVDASAGNFSIGSGTLDGVTITGGDVSGTTLTVLNGLTMNDHTLTMQTVTFDGASQAVDHVNINALVFVGGPNSNGPVTLTVGPNATIQGFILEGPQSGDTLLNNGTILAASPSFVVNIIPPFELPYYMTWSTSLNVSNVVNNGLLQAIQGSTLTINSANLVNTSTGILSANGSTMNLNGTWMNSGVISATNGGVVNLGGSFATADIGTLQVDSTSTVSIAGTLTNTGSTLATASTGTLSLNGGTIIGGTVDETSGSALCGKGTLDGVYVKGGNLNATGQILIRNGLTMDPGHQIEIATSGGLAFDDSGQTTVDNLTIRGDFVWNWGLGSPVGIGASGPDSGGPVTLTLGPHMLLQGNFELYDGTQSGCTVINNGTIISSPPASQPSSGLFSSSESLISPSYFTNNGLLEAEGSGLQIGATSLFGQTSWTNGPSGVISADNGGWLELAGNWTNAGTIRVSNGSRIQFDGNLATSQIGTISIDATSAIVLNGTLSNTGSTFVVPGSLQLGYSNGPYSGWVVSFSQPVVAEVDGGTINVTSGTPVQVWDATLNGVHVAGADLWVGTGVNGNASLTVENGLVMDPGHQIVLNSHYFATAELTFSGLSQTVDNLTITGVSNAYLNVVNNGWLTPPTDTLILGPNTLVQGAMTIADNSSTVGTLINNGTIDANSAGNSLWINITNFVNNGNLEASSGGVLQIVSSGLVNNGAIALHGGTVNVYPAKYDYQTGDLNVADGTLAGSGIIDANIILCSDPSTLAFELRSDSDYDLLTVNGSVTLAGNLEISLADGFEPSGSDVFTVLTVDSSDTLSGEFTDVADGGRLETADGSGSFLVNYESGAYANEIVLSDFEASNVPEPAAAGIVGMGALSMLARRRRRPAIFR